MTLAETASIMCETIILEAALEQTGNKPAGQLAILETRLVGNAAQVIVDIYSRYLFEKEVFRARAKSELSCRRSVRNHGTRPKATYGDGLDERYLAQKYMWTWKPHYYSAGLSFYNFPYAFGLLFATGLYAIYQQRGAGPLCPITSTAGSDSGEAPAAELVLRVSASIFAGRNSGGAA